MWPPGGSSEGKQWSRLLRKSPRTRSISSWGISDLSVPSWWPEAPALYAESKWDTLGTPQLPTEGRDPGLKPQEPALRGEAWIPLLMPVCS